MKIAIIGSRTFTDYGYLKECLSGTRIDHIVSGGAQGADNLAEKYAKEHNIPITVIKPDYTSHGKAATHIRNREIVDSVESVFAFWNGKPGGTKSVIAYAEKSGKPVSVHLDPEIKSFSRKIILGEPQSPNRVKEMYSTLDSSSSGGKKLKILKQQIIDSNQPRLFRLAVEERFNPEKFKHFQGKENVFIAVPSTTGMNKFPEEICIKLQKTFGGSIIIDGIKPVHRSQAKKLDGIQRVVQNRKYTILEGALNVERLKGKNIVLVDDVSTTGASIDGMRQALLEKGVKVDNIVTLCQSELRLATEKDFDRIAEKVAPHHPKVALSDKEKKEDLKNKLIQCFEGCLKHKLNWIERDISGNTPKRIHNRKDIYAVLTGEIERITRDGKSLLPVLLQRRPGTGLDRAAVEGVQNIPDAQELRGTTETRPGLGEHDSRRERGPSGAIEEPRKDYGNRTEKATRAGGTGKINSAEDITDTIKHCYSITIPPSVKESIRKGISNRSFTSDDIYERITESLNAAKNEEYAWYEKPRKYPSIETVFCKSSNTITDGDIIIKCNDSNQSAFEAYHVKNNTHKYLGSEERLAALKSRVEQYFYCSRIRDAVNNSLRLDIQPQSKAKFSNSIEFSM